jgi:hypothetical protein
MRAPLLSSTLFACSVLLSSAAVRGQRLPSPAPQQSALPASAPVSHSAASSDRYAAESIVVEHSDTVYSMNADGTGYREQHLVAKVQSEAAVRELGILNVGFAGASERVEIQYARVRRADGSVIETPITDALEQPQPVTREAPFYSDLKQMQLPIKSLRAGDTLEWKIRVVRTKAEAPGQFWGQALFMDQGIFLSETVELRFPKALSVNVWTNPKLGRKAVESTAGDQRVYRWESASLTPTTGPEAEAETKRKEKEVWTADQELDAKEGKLPSVAWTTFKSWEEVGSWYRGLEGDRMAPDATLKAKVAELTAGKTSMEDKVRAVYGFVGPQVRYIGVAFGIGRYQPHHADEVLENQYGDCKDKGILLGAMLQALGLHPDAALIGAGIRFNEAVPSPAAFNHLITHVVVDGQETWLDSTAEVAPYRMLTATIRDKQALVIPETGAAKLERTPALPPFPSFQTMKVEGTLTADGTESSRVTIVARGDGELMMREILHQIAPAQYELFSQKFWSGLGFDGTTSHSEIGRPEDTSEPVRMAFDDKREKAGGDWEHYRIVAQLMPPGLPVPDEKTPPVQAIQLGAPQVMTSSFALKLPEGWGAELPEAVHEKADFATYDLTFRFDKGTVYAERKLAVLQPEIPVRDWSKYKQWLDKTQANSSPYIQLTRTNRKADASGKAEPGAGGPPAPSVNNAEAAKLIQKAFESMRTMQVDEAQPLLDQAKALNEQQKFLWSGYGYLNMLRGANNEAIRDYRKELDLHRDAYNAYPALVQVQLQSRKRDEAMNTLREWAAADPSDPASSIWLSSLQLEDGRPSDAYITMEHAIAKLPEEKRKADAVVLALTNAEMRNSMQAKAAATLVELLKTTDDPLTLNNGAYSLSEANLELPAAEAAERRALAKMDAETASWTLDEAPALLKQKTSLLTASWDTMGWILFRESKFEESRSYVEAAWRNQAASVVGEHLGDIEMALHQPGPALTDYELAKSAGGKSNTLDEKQAKAKEAGGEVSSVDAQRQLAALRTVRLGPANGHQGVAEYKLLLAKGRVERVEAEGDKTVAGGAEMLRTMQVPQMFPAESGAKLAKKGILNCYADECKLIFEP